MVAALGRLDPSEVTWQSTEGDFLALSCLAERSSGRLGPARDDCESSLRIHQRLVDESPAASNLHEDLARTLVNLGELELNASHAPAATSLFRRAVEALSRERAKGASNSGCGPYPEPRAGLARAELATGDVASARRDAAAAREALEARALAAPGSWQLADFLVDAELVEGDGATAASDAAAAHAAFSRGHDRCAALPGAGGRVVTAKLHCAEAAA
jgi:hypothetical protein